MQSNYQLMWNVQKQPPEVFYKKGILKYFTIFAEKHLCWNLLLTKLECSFMKKGLQHRFFPVNIMKFLTTPILRNICASECFNVVAVCVVNPLPSFLENV